jgi:hypothetical protein
VDGLLTANGGRGWYYRGPAGSGGAIFLSGLKVTGSGTLRANGGMGQDYRGPGGGGRIAVWYHMSLAAAEERIARQDVSGLSHSAAYPSFPDEPCFTGELQADVYMSTLPNQPQAGITGFYTPGTLVILR